MIIDRNEIERKISLDEKIGIIVLEITKIKTIKETKLWQDMLKLYLYKL